MRSFFHYTTRNRGQLKIKNALTFVFAFSCFTLAGYMSFLQFQSYVKNEDSTAISYETFHNDNDDAYPTFSVCLYKEGGGIFETKTSPKYCSYPCNISTYNADNSKICYKHCSPIEYYDMLRGNKKDEYNLSTLAFEQKTLNIEHITTEFYTQLKTGSTIKKIRFGIAKSNHTFMKSYQDFSHVCITKEGSHGTGHLLRRDYLELDVVTLLMFADPDIHIFVHQKGRLLTELGQPHVIIKNGVLVNAKKAWFKYGFSYEANLRVNMVDVLKKRPNAVIPCDELLHDEDNLWINKAIEVIGCIPPFFRRFVWNSTINGKTEISNNCNMKQLNNYARKYSAYLYFSNISRLYDEPCYQATNLVSYEQSVIPSVKDFDFLSSTNSGMKVKIQIEYAMKSYKKATNNRSFGILSLWSQIGGFVGMFLGYSLLQLPNVAWETTRNIINVIEE